METAYKEYEEWLSEQVESETKQKCEKAKKKLEQLMPFENELVCYCNILEIVSLNAVAKVKWLVTKKINQLECMAKPSLMAA